MNFKKNLCSCETHQTKCLYPNVNEMRMQNLTLDRISKRAIRSCSQNNAA